MPQNNNLKPVSLPMELKFGQEPRTEFFNNLSHLKVELVDDTFVVFRTVEVVFVDDMLMVHYLSNSL